MHQPHAARSFPVFFANYGYSWVSRDVTSFAQISVHHVGVPRVSNLVKLLYYRSIISPTT